MRFLKSVLIAAMLAGAALPPASAVALPLAPAQGGAALAGQIDEAGDVIPVRSRGAGVAAGIIGGMIIGGIIASQARPRHYYDYPPPYAYQPYPPPYDPAIAYCMQRYRSYDPYSMTYLGYDGVRRPCP